MIFAALAFAVGVVTGAYSHKWLAKVTGAPSNITPANAIGAGQAVAQKVAAEVKKL